MDLQVDSGEEPPSASLAPVKLESDASRLEVRERDPTRMGHGNMMRYSIPVCSSSDADVAFTISLAGFMGKC